MTSTSSDLSLASVLADPMIRALNTADHVTRGEFETLLRDKARMLGAAKAPRPAAIRCTASDTGWLSQMCFA